MERASNKDALQLAESIRSKREEDIKSFEHDIIPGYLKKINFLDYYLNYINNYSKKDIRMLICSYREFKKYLGRDSIKPFEITESLVTGFKDYLGDNFRGETPSSYLGRFKKVMKQAYKDNLFYKNPAEFVISRVAEGIKKEILTFNEIQKLANTPCGNENVRLSFLFCLNTGLRHCDVKDLKWQHIDFEAGQLRKIQTKVKTTSSEPYIYIDLNSTSEAILKQLDKGKAEDNVFSLPSIESCLKTLKTGQKGQELIKTLPGIQPDIALPQIFL